MKKFLSFTIKTHLIILLGLLISATSAMAETTTGTADANPDTHLNTQISANPANKKVNLSPIFVQLSDAMGAVKSGDDAKAQALVRQIDQEFSMIPEHTTDKGAMVTQAIKTALTQPTADNLASISHALTAFDKQQNPTDYTQQRKEVSKRMTSAYQQFAQVINSATPDKVDELKNAYHIFNRAWLASEKIVRNTSMGHYGKIETAMALIRVTIETQPLNIAQLQKHSQSLQQAIDSYGAGGADGDVVKPTGVTLSSGIALLETGLKAFQSGDKQTGQDKLGEFIQIWSSIEGEINTRNPSLYSRIESQIPIIMAHGQEQSQQDALASLIDELRAISPTANYTAIDAMLILLREGLEALLIVVALLSALNVAKQPKGKKYVYLGVGLGVLASMAGAVILQQFFPMLTSGQSREMLEGYIGIVAVFMMVLIGAWLHSKSSVKAWNAFIKKHMGEILTTGSFVSLFGLSFLSVFREGAETILFYVGILPNISYLDFILGIMMAMVILALAAFVLLRTSVQLPIPKLFKLLTWLIYLLGFKILGVSIKALQLTGNLAIDTIPSLPAMPWIGFYPTIQTITAQVLYIVVIILLQWWLRYSKSHQHTAVKD